MNERDLVLVTVTYGSRGHLLGELLSRTLGLGGVSHAVVVDNNSASNLNDLANLWGSRLTIVKLGANKGSAEGYGAGIRVALQKGALRLWLMDDDNAPKAGTAEYLVGALDGLAENVGKENAMVIGNRRNMSNILSGEARPFPRSSSFMGFHIADIPNKIIRHMKRSPRVVHDGLVPEIPEVMMPYAPYGGLMAYRDAFVRLGYPCGDFVLYADDMEYTSRFTRLGGRIKFVRHAAIDDLEPSWHWEEPCANSFIAQLKGGGAFRIYYTFRNHTWLYRYRLATSKIMYSINKYVYLLILWIFALWMGKCARFREIRRAIADGEAKRLGINPMFPLP